MYNKVQFVQGVKLHSKHRTLIQVGTSVIKIKALLAFLYTSVGFRITSESYIFGKERPGPICVARIESSKIVQVPSYKKKITNVVAVLASAVKPNKN